ncbi:hypothetical protein RQN30_06905 [Arcanobacterium hippocoleae]
MIVEISMALNISSPAKRRFVVERLVSTLHQLIPSRYYFTWQVRSIPCLVVYTVGSLRQTQALVTALQQQVDDYCSTLNEQELQGSAVYTERWDDLRKMNSLRETGDTPNNFQVTWHQIAGIPRRGEYIAQIERDLYNEQLYRVQPLVEESLRLLTMGGSSLEIPFLVGLFYVASIQLDRRCALRGYQSFKSHMIGFLSYEHADMKLYARDFSRYFDLNRDMFTSFLNRLGSGKNSKNDPMIELLQRWEVEFSKIFDEHQRARASGFWVNPYRAMRYGMARRRFRGMSAFHREAFSKKSHLMDGVEFSTFRMLVNFVYLLLPAMGVSSRKRVQASYILTALMEGKSMSKNCSVEGQVWFVSRQNTFVTTTSAGTLLRTGGRQFNVPAGLVSEEEIRAVLSFLATPRPATDGGLRDLSPRALKLLSAGGSVYRGPLPTASPVATYLIRNYPDPAKIDVLLRSRCPQFAPDSSRLARDLWALMHELLPPAVPSSAGPILTLVDDNAQKCGKRTLSNAFYTMACPSWRYPGEILLLGSEDYSEFHEFRDSSPEPVLARAALGRPHVSRLVAFYLLLMWIDSLSVAPRLSRAYAVSPDLEVAPLCLEQPPFCAKPVRDYPSETLTGLSVHESVDALMKNRNGSTGILIEPNYFSNGTKVEIRLATPRAMVTATGQGADLGTSVLAAVSEAFMRLGAALGTDARVVAGADIHPTEHWPIHALSQSGLALVPNSSLQADD